VTDLPDRQSKALLGAFALSTDPVPPDALLTGIAVLTLLSSLSEDHPLLVIADDAQWLDRGSLDTLVFAARRLDGEQEALLLAAVADSPDLTAAAVPGLTADALAPAEKAGLIRVNISGPRFTHPLVRSAVYHAAPFAERACAHRKIADTLRGQPDRYA